MQLPILTKRQLELKKALKEIITCGRSIVSMAAGSQGITLDYPEGITDDQYCHLSVYKIARLKKLNDFTQCIAKEGWAAVKDFYHNHDGSIDEVDAPYWMESLCEKILSHITVAGLNAQLESIGYSDKKLSETRNVDPVTHFLNEIFEFNYPVFKKLLIKLYEETSLDVFKQAILALELDYEVSSLVEINQDNVLDTLTRLSSADLVSYAAVALDNISINDFKRSLMKLKVKTNLINAGDDQLLYIQLAFKKLQSEMLLLNWINNVATHEEDAQVFAEQWFHKLTGFEPNRNYVKKIHKVKVPENRAYRALTNAEISELSEVMEDNLIPGEFKWASAVSHFGCGKYILNQECDYFNALDELQATKGRKYSFLIVDFLHALARKNKFFAGEWLMKMAN